MRGHFRTLRLTQLDRDLSRFREAHGVVRPARGWLNATREAFGISSRELGTRLGSGHQLALQLEKSEADDSITLRSLRNVANALDCDLVYALVPRAGSLRETLENRAQDEARRIVAGVEHSMALEDQAVGRIEEVVAAETKRLLRKRAAR